jgi:uncharacterized protein (DUF4213/DUF364 family)
VPLLDDLIRSLEPAPEEVRDVAAGPYWTLVVASHCGVAFGPGAPESPQDAGPPGPQSRPGADRHDRARSLHGKHVGDVLPYALSCDPAEASIGVAAINAVVSGRCDPGPFRPYRMPRARGKSVAVVGEFSFIEDLRSIAEQVYVIRKDPASGDYTGTDVERLIPQADIALISGSAIVDGTLEYLLRLARPCYTVVHGPSTPLSPVLFEYGADQLVGVLIKDTEGVRRLITEGASSLAQCPGIQPVVLIR